MRKPAYLSSLSIFFIHTGSILFQYQLGCSQFIIHQKNDPDKDLWVGKLILQRPIDSEANAEFKLKLDASVSIGETMLELMFKHDCSSALNIF